MLYIATQYRRVFNSLLVTAAFKCSLIVVNDFHVALSKSSQILIIGVAIRFDYSCAFGKF